MAKVLASLSVLAELLLPSWARGAVWPTSSPPLDLQALAQAARSLQLVRSLEEQDAALWAQAGAPVEAAEQLQRVRQRVPEPQLRRLAQWALQEGLASLVAPGSWGAGSVVPGGLRDADPFGVLLVRPAGRLIVPVPGRAWGPAAGRCHATRTVRNGGQRREQLDAQLACSACGRRAGSSQGMSRRTRALQPVTAWNYLRDVGDMAGLAPALIGSSQEGGRTQQGQAQAVYRRGAAAGGGQAQAAEGESPADQPPLPADRHLHALMRLCQARRALVATWQAVALRTSNPEVKACACGRSRPAQAPQRGQSSTAWEASQPIMPREHGKRRAYAATRPRAVRPQAQAALRRGLQRVASEAASARSYCQALLAWQAAHDLMVARDLAQVSGWASPRHSAACLLPPQPFLPGQVSERVRASTLAPVLAPPHCSAGPEPQGNVRLLGVEA